MNRATECLTKNCDSPISILCFEDKDEEPRFPSAMEVQTIRSQNVSTIYDYEIWRRLVFGANLNETQTKLMKALPSHHRNKFARLSAADLRE